jgi:hypothetical protein
MSAVCDTGLRSALNAPQKLRRRTPLRPAPHTDLLRRSPAGKSQTEQNC